MTEDVGQRCARDGYFTDETKPEMMQQVLFIYHALCFSRARTLKSLI